MSMPPSPATRHRTLSLASRGSDLAVPSTQRHTLRKLALASTFDQALASAGLAPLRARGIEVMQINVGRLCNQTCRHCHVDAGPDRREVITRETLEACLDVLRKHSIGCVDITGGAPELVPDFRWFVRECRGLGLRVIDRCNLTIIETRAHQDLPEFFASQRVELVCSLPHYRALSTDRQRGDGVFEKSIAALQKLNRVGYGSVEDGLRLSLVTNPVGAFLPARQASLEREWKERLYEAYGIVFDELLTITNMPISRYLEWLLESGNLEAYMNQLLTSFNPAAARGVMCRTTLSVGWDGTLHDCDFNQMLDMPLTTAGCRNVRDFDLARLSNRTIAVDQHCFGCTAGAGSSCGGATTTD